MFIALFVVALLLAILLRKQIYSYFETYRLAKLIQGPPLVPFIGCLQFLGLNAVQVNALHEKYAKCYARGFRIWAFGKLIYIAYAADDVETILTNPKNSEKSFAYKFLESFLSQGLLVSHIQKWFQRRKILTPAFHFSMLHKFLPSMKHQTKILIDVLKKEEQNNATGTNLQDVISRFTLNTICETAMGVATVEANELDEYRKQIHEYGDLLVERIITPWAHKDALYKLFEKKNEEDEITRKIHAFSGGIIANRRKTRRVNNNYEGTLFGKQRHAMLDTLFTAENNGQINAAGIQEEVDTFIFEGYDTTMTAITFTLFMIAHHSDVQKRLYEELNQIYDARNFNVNHFSELKYLELVIKESLRLYPSVPLIGRVLGEETMVNGVKLPRGTTIHILTNVLHRDPNHFPKPDMFDPERFTLENRQNSHPFAYIPFSASHRNCIGQKFAMLELKIVISEIIMNFRLEPITKREDVIIKADMVLRTVEPILIRFISR